MLGNLAQGGHVYLGIRKIRSAGRSSGSIEVTLPAQLQTLEGIECKLIVRDGPNPEIVFHPDLGAAQSLFHELWHTVCQCLEAIGEPGDFAPADFALALFAPSHWQERPPLAYMDALIVLRQREAQEQASLHALCRLLTFLAVAAAYRLELQGKFALAFGDALAYVLTGISVGLGTDFERGMAYRTFWNSDQAQSAPATPLYHHLCRPTLGGPDRSIQEQIQSGFRRVYEQMRTWQDWPETYANDREKWYRALTIEMGVNISVLKRIT